MADKLTADEMFKLIESLDAEQIGAAARAMKKDAVAAAQVASRYDRLLLAIGGKTLKALASLPKKWEGLDNERKVAALRAWPQGMPFVSETLDLRAKLRVDRFRDSHYSHRVADALPDDIGRHQEIRKIYLDYQVVERLPDSLGELAELTELSLKDTGLKELPVWLAGMDRLRVLNLSHNSLDAFDEERLPSASLESLDVTWVTEITRLPSKIVEAKRLKRIDTTYSGIDASNRELIGTLRAQMPGIVIESRHADAFPAVGRFTGEQGVLLRDEVVPDELFTSANALRRLIVQNVVSIADRFAEIPTLERLKMSGPRLGSGAFPIPASIGALPCLREFTVGTDDKEMTLRLGGLARLEALALVGPSMESLSLELEGAASLWHVELLASPAFSFQLPRNLRSLTLNSMSRVPVDLYALLEHFPRLELLRVRVPCEAKQVERLPADHPLRALELGQNVTETPELARLPHLTELKIAANSDSTHIERVYGCASLRSLTFDTSTFAFPEGISALKNLETLAVQFAFPADVGALPSLQHLVAEYLEAPAMRSLKSALRKGGSKAVVYGKARELPSDVASLWRDAPLPLGAGFLLPRDP